MLTISVHYMGSSKRYTFKAMDDTIKKGDFCVVNTNFQYSIVKVDEVHDTPKVSNKFQLTWVVQKIDPTKYDELITADHVNNPSKERF